MDAGLIPILLALGVFVAIVIVIAVVLNGRAGESGSGSDAAIVYPAYTDPGHGHSHDGSSPGHDGGGSFGGDGGGGGGGGDGGGGGGGT